jgi:hypothetical protein
VLCCIIAAAAADVTEALAYSAVCSSKAGFAAAMQGVAMFQQ